MTDHDDLERTIAGWLEDRAQSSGPVEGFERVLDATRRQQPLPGWLAVVGGRWIGDAGRTGRGLGGTRLIRLDLSWSTGLAVLLLALAIVGGSIFVAAQIAPQPAPRDPRLAYIADGTLYLADWEGRNPIRLDGASWSADGCSSVYSEGTVWSPDGRYLAYRSGWGTACETTVQTVHVRDAEGSGVAEFQAGIGWQVAWAPDSKRIATWSTVDGEIDIRGVDGVLQAQITLPAGFCVCADRDPAWTHDGSALLLRMRDPSEPSQFWRLPIPDGPPSVLGGGGIRVLAFSKDGTQAAFWADGSLRVASADDMAVTRVDVEVPVEVTGLVWSPTGDRVAVTTVRDRPLGDDGPVGPRIEDLQVLDVARGQLSTLATATEPRGLTALAFTPAGDRILFAQGTEGRDSLWKIATDGSTERELVPGADWGDWQPMP